MSFPDFYDAAPRLVVRDPLADFLGAAEEGLIEYGYADAVRLAGHSCPTVAGAWLMTVRALQALYDDATPERGAVRVGFSRAATEGVTGVIAAVVTLLTGATVDTGFKGLGGRFDRRHLLAFGQELPLEARFERVDGLGAFDVAVNVRVVPADRRLPELMGAVLSGVASAEAIEAFRSLWQARVRAILIDHADDPALVTFRRVTT